MSDRRLTPATDRVVLQGWQRPGDTRRVVPGRAARIVAPLADLLDAPGGNLDRQLPFGAAVTVIEEDSGRGHAFLRADWDGYVGHVATDALGAPLAPTHRVRALSSHVYPEASIKTRPLTTLPMGAELAVAETVEGFARLSEGGFVPRRHLQPVGAPVADWVAQAEMFLNVPYLWGGNGPLGIDCAGLVQVALRLAERRFPADSDLQERAPGLQTVTGPPRRGDLVFWPGHVAIFQDAERIIHANAHHMAVASEPFDEARRRIEGSQGVHPSRIARLAPTTRNAPA